MKQLLKLALKIKNLEIQGASNVAKEAVIAYNSFSLRLKSKNKADFLKNMDRAKKILFETRPTELLMRNLLNYISSVVHKSNEDSVLELKKNVKKASLEALKIRETARNSLSKIGANKIKNNSVIFTHCHSSNVENILTLAKKQGKNFKVFNTETRPLFQGRITAVNLIKAGIDTTMIVDSAMLNYIRKADMILLGCDAILSDGSCLNKIGSGLITFIASQFNIPIYICGITFKFDPMTLTGTDTEIEERAYSEVWDKKPKKLKILNPAFERIDPNLIDGYICEFGVVSPSEIYKILQEKEPWMFQ